MGFFHRIHLSRWRGCGWELPQRSLGLAGRRLVLALHVSGAWGRGGEGLGWGKPWGFPWKNMGETFELWDFVGIFENGIEWNLFFFWILGITPYFTNNSFYIIYHHFIWSRYNRENNNSFNNIYLYDFIFLHFILLAYFFFNSGWIIFTIFTLG